MITSHRRLDVQVHTQRLFAVDDRPAAARVEMLHALLIATVDELIEGARIIVDDLMQLDDKALWRHDRGELQTILVVLAVVIQVRIGNFKSSKWQ